MDHRPGRYSKYLRFINISIHVFFINATLYYFDKTVFYNVFQIAYINLSWLAIAYVSNFYKTFRFTQFTKLLARLILQYVIFFLAYFSFYALTQQSFDVNLQLKIFAFIFIGLLGIRLFFFFALRAYRMHGGNFRRVVIIGKSANDKTLEEFFKNRLEFGYKFLGFFSDKNHKDTTYIGKVNQAFDFILSNNVDEIYCSLSDLTKDQIKDFILFAESHYKILKFIPKSDNLFRNDVELEYYDYIPIVTFRKNPLSNPLESTIKRLFDIIFSLFVILFIMSWLIPILFVLIKIESKGPLFFKQIREGLNGKRFYCLKFRSMRRNELEDIIQTSKNDERITKVGAFIRKTSIDELPQFFNVLLGTMSVVGPRPHMISQGNKFKEIVDKYAVRHFVKPGITGLAQVKGYRGEISKKTDIKNRVKFDLFYIENWSLLLDIKIIVLTILNAIKGEEKAY
jgi:Undecaprenyl-phosphate glucose phosphotransferase